jgi:hypothetical protein
LFQVSASCWSWESSERISIDRERIRSRLLDFWRRGNGILFYIVAISLNSIADSAGYTRVIRWCDRTGNGKAPKLLNYVDPSDKIDSLRQGYLTVAQRLRIPGWKDEKSNLEQLVQKHLT